MTFKLQKSSLFIPLFCALVLCLPTLHAGGYDTLKGMSVSEDDSTNAKVEPSPTQGYYLGGFGGVAFPNTLKNVINRGYSIGAHYGYRDDNYRTELALNFIDNGISHSSITTLNAIDLLFNLYYEFNPSGVVLPFLGVGAGYFNGWVNNCFASVSSNCSLITTGSRIGYQGIGGIGFALGTSARVDARYRYLTFSGRNVYAQNIFEIVVSYLSY